MKLNRAVGSYPPRLLYAASKLCRLLLTSIDSGCHHFATLNTPSAVPPIDSRKVSTPSAAPVSFFCTSFASTMLARRVAAPARQCLRQATRSHTAFKPIFLQVGHDRICRRRTHNS
nr:hypothetical protein CFP56_16855 [Quercus suber]